jgi:hypothetical protein
VIAADHRSPQLPSSTGVGDMPDVIWAERGEAHMTGQNWRGMTSGRSRMPGWRRCGCWSIAAVCGGVVRGDTVATFAPG